MCAPAWARQVLDRVAECWCARLKEERFCCAEIDVEMHLWCARLRVKLVCAGAHCGLRKTGMCLCALREEGRHVVLVLATCLGKNKPYFGEQFPGSQRW